LTDLTVACGFLGRVFFFDTDGHRQAFAEDPLTYVFEPQPPVSPFTPKISVLGHPELAARIAAAVHAKLIRPKDVIASAVKSHTAFGAYIRGILVTGKMFEPTIFRTALRALLLRHDCQVRGYVLDGYPAQLMELMELREDGFLPSTIVATADADQQMLTYAIENFHNVVEIETEANIWMMTIKATNALTNACTA
jgi:hypothetical protein